MLKILPKLLLTGLLSCSLFITGTVLIPKCEASELQENTSISDISFAESITESIAETTEDTVNPSIVVLEKSDNQLSPIQYIEPVIENNDESQEHVTSKKDLIFVGDSRTVGMQTIIDDDATVIAEVGKGYNWLVNTADSKLRDSITDHSILVFNLGVNDLADAQKYEEYLSSLSADFPDLQIYVVSVNPVENYPTVSNEEIEMFNSVLSTAGTDYIDTYSQLLSKGFSTQDGLHYTDDTYRVIYDQIIGTIL